MSRFATLRPALFHVTERSAIPSIRERGLLSAASLCALFGVAEAALDANRSGWMTLRHADHGEATLRRQFLPDGPLQARLAPDHTPTSWRRFINRHVFLSLSRARAERFLRFEAYRDQVVLQWQTQALLDHGVALAGCRYNNGMIDRSPPSRRRLRSPEDYRPITDAVDPASIKEVIAAAIPSCIPFACAG